MPPHAIRAEITGFPAAAVESALRFREDGAADIRETGLYEVQITVMTPFPGTPLYARLAEQGRLLFPGAWERCTLIDVNFQPEKMSVSELERGFRNSGPASTTLPSSTSAAAAFSSAKANCARSGRFPETGTLLHPPLKCSRMNSSGVTGCGL